MPGGVPTLHWNLPMTRFEQMVEAAVAAIPARFRARLRNVAWVVEPEPTEAHYARAGGRGGGTLLGLYEGRPLTERTVFTPAALPDRITIFEGPHRRMARNPAHLRRLVQDTVLHEVAHFFGFDERRVLRWEARRMNR